MQVNELSFCKELMGKAIGKSLVDGAIVWLERNTDAKSYGCSLQVHLRPKRTKRIGKRNCLSIVLTNSAGYSHKYQILRYYFPCLM